MLKKFSKHQRLANIPTKNHLGHGEKRHGKKMHDEKIRGTKTLDKRTPGAKTKVLGVRPHIGISTTLGLILILVISVFPTKIFAQTTDSGTTNVDAEIDEDRDGDGMPDVWEQLYGFDFTDPADAAFDPDLDGLTNLEEYLYGTNPLDSDTDGGSVSDGDEIANGTNPLDPTDDIIKEADNGKKRASPKPSLDKRADSDGDGLSDVQEKRFFTDKNNPDTDNDGIGDYDEIFKYFLDPLNWDTDGDGLKDGEEIFVFLTSPKDPDTDGDGLLDGQEVVNTKTSPTLFDTDSGGIGDGDEIILNKTNPLDGADDFGQLIPNGSVSPKIAFYIEDFNLENLGFDTNKAIELVNNLGFEVVIQETKDISVKSIRFNQKEYDTEVITKEVLQEGSDIRILSLPLKTPEEPNTYELEITFSSISRGQQNTKEIVYKRDIRVKEQGHIFGRTEGVFGSFFRKIGVGKYGLQKNVKVSLYKYSDINDSWNLYKPTARENNNPSVSTAGNYFFIVEPGLYKIEIGKPYSETSAKYFTSQKYAIYSNDIYIRHNYDKFGWAMLFILIYNIVAGTNLLIKNMKHHFKKFRPMST